MVNFKKLIIDENTSILDAIKIIDNSIYRTCFVVNNHNKLIGSITDGDIRRGLLKKLILKVKYRKFVTEKPLVL